MDYLVVSTNMELATVLGVGSIISYTVYHKLEIFQKQSFESDTST